MSIRATLRNASSLNESYWTLPPRGNRSVDVAYLNVEWFTARGLAKSTSSRGPSYVSHASRLEGRQCIIYSVVANVIPNVTSGLYAETFLSASMVHISDRGVATGTSTRQLIYEAGQPCGMIDKARGCLTESSLTSVQLSMGVGDYIDLLAAISQPLGGGELLQRNATAGNRQEVLRFLEASSQSNNQAWRPPPQGAGIFKPNVTSSTEQALYNTIRQINVALRSNSTFETSLLEEQEQGKIMASTQRITGTVMVDTPHIKVRWPWLAFPALLILGAVVLLWSTIIECGFEGVPLWKDNPLAIVMHTDWRRPNGTRVLKTSGDLAKTSKHFRAEYIGNAHADTMAITITVGENNTTDEVEMMPVSTAGFANKMRHRIMRERTKT